MKVIIIARCQRCGTNTTMEVGTELQIDNAMRFEGGMEILKNGRWICAACNAERNDIIHNSRDRLIEFDTEAFLRKEVVDNGGGQQD